MKNFNLIVARKSAGYNQTQLAELCGTTQNTISSIENGVYNPSLKLAFRLSVALNIPIEKLFNDTYSICKVMTVNVKIRWADEKNKS